MGSLAWRTVRGCLVSRQASPFTEDKIALRESQQESRVVEEGRGKTRALPVLTLDQTHASPASLPRPSLVDTSIEEIY